MVDTATPGGPTLGAPHQSIAGIAPSMSADQAASARETWVSLGLDVARFDARMAGTLAPKSNNSDEPVVRPPEVRNRLSDAQVTEAVAELQKYMPDEKIREALAKDGYELSEITPEALASMRHDADWGLGEEADPKSMAISYREYGIDPGSVTPLQDGNLRAFAASLRLEQAPSFMGELLAIDQRVNSMTEASQKLWAATEKQEAVRALGGEDAYAEAVMRVSGFLDALPKSSVKDGLVEGFSSKSAYFLRTMLSHVKRIDAWHGSRPGKR